MNAEMVPLQIIGLKADLPRILLRLLRRVGCVQIDDVADSPKSRHARWHWSARPRGDRRR